MQSFGRVVVKGWELIPIRSVTPAFEHLCRGRSGTSWVLPAVITTLSAASTRAISYTAATITTAQTTNAPCYDEAESACAALYFTGTAPATDILGPLSLRNIPGKGRGLVAQRELRTGDLVMAVQPVAILHGPQDAMPSPDSLVAQLESSAAGAALPPAHSAALRQMFGGRPTTTTTTTPNNNNNNSHSPDDQPTTSTTNVTAAPAAAPAADDDDDGVGGVDFQAVVSYNAYGDEYEDLPAADLRGGGPPQSHVGLWPHFANLNHACAPNCVHYVVGSTMVVRAVQAVPEGSELLISYLGRDDLAPRQVRQAVLHSRYGFRCDCARCRTEEELPEELQTLLQQLYDRARHELAPRFERLASAASLAAAAAEGLDGGALYNDDDDDDEEGVSEADGGGGAAAGSVKLAQGLTAAEVAKRALRKQQQQQPPQGSSPQWPQWPGDQLASLEPRLEECARELHHAVQELQEEDEASEDLGVGPAAAPANPPATTTTSGAAGGPLAASALASGSASASSLGGASGRQLTRVQCAQAAAYQLLELLHLHAELTAAAAGGAAVGGRAAATAAATLQACWHVLDAISRGSELQVFQSAKLLTDALTASGYNNSRGGKGGRGAAAAAAVPPPEVVREAAALLGQSLVARYGRLRGQELTRVTQAAIRTSRGFL